ncbi:uncharacterized protein LOC111033548 [Myzus persicae]|uniref:uncharacterized protein LOC111033548 n=1 Tax=Myzus persicae TaxID=13164 RepID=UPI000B9366B7|nr:uncharacterized protein LOC111033548 [Myzus persicae]
MMISFLIDCLINHVTCVSLITIFTALFYHYSTSTYGKWRKLKIPHVPPVPLFGNTFKMMTRLEHQIDTIEKIYNQFPDHKLSGFYQMMEPMLLVRDPELINRILTKDFLYFTDHGVDIDPSSSPLAKSLFLSSGQKWRTMRQKLSPGFTSGKLKDTYSQINECGDEMVSSIVETIEKKTDQIELKTLSGRFSTDVIATCAFGLKLDSIKNGDSEFRRYVKMLFTNTPKQMFVMLLSMTCPKVAKFLKLKMFPEEAINFFYKVFVDVIKYREEHNVVRNDITQTLIQAREELVLKKTSTTEDTFTDDDIIGNAIFLFSAGSETISSLLSFCLYELALNKEIQDKLREEICSMKAKHDGVLNNDYLMDLHYTNMVLEETGRKYSIAFNIVRVATKTYTLPDESFVIEKGQKIIIPMFNIHRDAKYYPDPLKFDPERFSMEQKSKQPNGTYIPFGDGPRLCLGKRFAESEMKLVLSKILSKFEVLPCDQTEIPLDIRSGSGLISPKNGVVLKFRPIIEHYKSIMMYFLADWLFDNVTYLSLIALFAIFYYYSTSTYSKWQKLNIPYLPPVPLFGNMLNIMLKLEYPSDLFDRIYNRFPDVKLVGFYQMREPMLLVCDPKLIHTILVKDFSHFTDHGFIMDTSTSVLGNSLFFANGQKWRTMRQKLSPGFTSGKLKDTYFQINECSEEMVSRIVDKIEKKTDQIDVKTMNGNFSTDVIGTCAFGMKLDTIKNDDSEFRRYAKTIFQRTTKQIIVQAITTIWPLVIKLFKLQMLPVESINFFHNVFTDVINYREEHNVIRNDLTQTLIQARKELVLNENSSAEDKYTDADIIGNAILFFTAGSETIASMLSFCLYELALNKEIQDKIRAEICSMKSKHDGQLNNDFLTDLNYTNMALEETGRKYSIAQVLMRVATKTYTLPDESFVIEKGQKLIIPMFSIHRDPKYYPDPLRFDPERFSAEQKSQRPNGTYMPFGDGPRVCIGKRFAESEMKLALTNVLSKFEVLPCEQTEIPLEITSEPGVISPKRGLVLKFRPITEY